MSAADRYNRDDWGRETPKTVTEYRAELRVALQGATRSYEEGDPLAHILLHELMLEMRLLGEVPEGGLATDVCDRDEVRQKRGLRPLAMLEEGLPALGGGAP